MHSVAPPSCRFTCSHEVGQEKPHPEMFAEAHRQAQFWAPDIKKEEILHVGDNLAADFCGARAVGFQAVFLDRSQSAIKVTQYQDWLEVCHSCSAYPQTMV